METIGERLKRVRRAKNKSQATLATEAGVSQGTIGNIESGVRGYGDSVVGIAKALGQSAEYMLCKTDGSSVDSHIGNVTPGPKTHGPYPLISEVQAGDWTELCENFQSDDAEEWGMSTRDLGPRGYMLRVRGESMCNPRGQYSFPEGMILHVNPDREPTPGQFVIVCRQGTNETTFKRYVMIDGEAYLEAINPDWPKDKKYLKLHPDDVWCGVVVDASIGKMP